uniref:Uncharacterized protein n=1 Tax=Micrurus paraensis TaxID=1970185 RepID=A0A2D4K5A1_9SAUR
MISCFRTLVSSSSMVVFVLSEDSFTPSFFLLPPLFPPVEKRYQVKRHKHDTRVRTVRLSNMRRTEQETRELKTAQSVLQHSLIKIQQSEGSLSETHEACKPDYYDPSN